MIEQTQPDAAISLTTSPEEEQQLPLIEPEQEEPGEEYMVAGLGSALSGLFRGVKAPRPKRPPKILPPQKMSQSVRAEAESVLGTYQAEYQEAVKKHRQEVGDTGVKPKELQLAEAQSMTWSLADLKARKPGAAMNEAEIGSTIMLLEKNLDEILKLRDLAIEDFANGVPDSPAAHALMARIGVHRDIQPVRLGASATAGRALAMHNDPMSGMTAFVDQLDKVMGNVHEGMPMERFLALLKTLKTKDQLDQMIRGLERATKGDMFIEAWKNALLSGLGTHVVNMTDNIVRIAFSVPERAAAARLASGGVVPGEASAMVAGLIGATADVWAVILEASNHLARDITKGAVAGAAVGTAVSGDPITGGAIGGYVGSVVGMGRAGEKILTQGGKIEDRKSVV